MAVGTGSIKRASNAAKAKTTSKAADNKEVNAQAGAVDETDKSVMEPEQEAASAKKETKAAPKKTTKSVAAKKAAAKTTEAKTTKKTVTKTAAKVSEEKKEKTYEVVEGITCNMPRYLL